MLRDLAQCSSGGWEESISCHQSFTNPEGGQKPSSTAMEVKHTNTLGNIHYVVKDHFISSLTRPLFYVIMLNHFNKELVNKKCLADEQGEARLGSKHCLKRKINSCSAA